MTHHITRLLPILILLTISGCRNASPATVIERADKPTIYGVESDDPEMNKAIATARTTFKTFESAFESGNPNYHSFAIKVGFASPNGKEHIWMGNVFKQNDTYYGLVGNDPQWTREVKYGDTLRIDTQVLSDWKYLDGNKLYGGFSIRLLRDRMSPEERKSFDAATGMIIE